MFTKNRKSLRSPLQTIVVERCERSAQTHSI